MIFSALAYFFIQFINANSTVLTGVIPKQSNSTAQIRPPWLNLRRKPELYLLPLDLDFLYGRDSQNRAQVQMRPPQNAFPPLSPSTDRPTDRPMTFNTKTSPAPRPEWNSPSHFSLFLPSRVMQKVMMTLDRQEGHSFILPKVDRRDLAQKDDERSVIFDEGSFDFLLPCSPSTYHTWFR